MNIAIFGDSFANGETDNSRNLVHFGLTLYLMDDGGGTDNYIYKTQALGANETFEHTGRIVLEATDELGFITASSANVDVTVSYLDQTL